MRKVGIIGSGRLGTTLARSLSKAGYEVSIINSKSPESLDLQIRILLPDVMAREVRDLIDYSEVIILAVPLRRIIDLPVPFDCEGKVVIDATNYWAPVDGELSDAPMYEFDSSDVNAKVLGAPDLVKTFNSVAYHELEEDALPAGSTERRAIPLAGNNEMTKVIASELIDAIGFDPVDLGELPRGQLFQPDTPLFNARLTAAELHELVG